MRIFYWVFKIIRNFLKEKKWSYYMYLKVNRIKEENLEGFLILVMCYVIKGKEVMK